MARGRQRNLLQALVAAAFLVGFLTLSQLADEYVPGAQLQEAAGARTHQGLVALRNSYVKLPTAASSTEHAGEVGHVLATGTVMGFFAAACVALIATARGIPGAQPADYSQPCITFSVTNVYHVQRQEAEAAPASTPALAIAGLLSPSFLAGGRISKGREEDSSLASRAQALGQGQGNKLTEPGTSKQPCPDQGLTVSTLEQEVSMQSRRLAALARSVVLAQEASSSTDYTPRRIAQLQALFEQERQRESSDVHHAQDMEEMGSEHTTKMASQAPALQSTVVTPKLSAHRVTEIEEMASEHTTEMSAEQTPEMASQASVLMSTVVSPKLTNGATKPELQSTIVNSRTTKNTTKPKLQSTVATPKLTPRATKPQLQSTVVTQRLTSRTTKPELRNRVVKSRATKPKMQSTVVTPKLTSRATSKVQVPSTMSALVARATRRVEKQEARLQNTMASLVAKITSAEEEVATSNALTSGPFQRYATDDAAARARSEVQKLATPQDLVPPIWKERTLRAANDAVKRANAVKLEV
eukprot:TRINITY_DN4033_c0_g1_i2.p1 TRINITY_DN4033_c0_g1~~TRINITY_DN4033_c0_g1_i2.p1  ORF type:complete len:528 (-),score=112.32 TRINITY_DN4033_c0_g1_i2:56-1639(-)